MMNQPQNDLLKDLEQYRWGTMMPVMVMLGGNITSLRSRGTCSFVLANSASFESQAADADDFQGWIRGLFGLVISDVLGNASSGKSSLEEIKKDLPDLENKMKAEIISQVEDKGLSVKNLIIEAIEAV